MLCPLILIAPGHKLSGSLLEGTCLQEDCAWWLKVGPYSGCSINLLAKASVQVAILSKGQTAKRRQ